MECTFLGHHADQTHSVLNDLKLPGVQAATLFGDNSTMRWRPLSLPRTGERCRFYVQAIDSGFNADQVSKLVQAQRRMPLRLGVWQRNAYRTRKRASATAELVSIQPIVSTSEPVFSFGYGVLPFPLMQGYRIMRLCNRALYEVTDAKPFFADRS